MCWFCIKQDGVLNGIDVNDWNPATDPFLGAKYQGFDNFYSAADLSGKKGAKAHLQSCFHLPGTLSYLARYLAGLTASRCAVLFWLCLFWGGASYLARFLAGLTVLYIVVGLFCFVLGCA